MNHPTENELNILTIKYLNLFSEIHFKMRNMTRTQQSVLSFHFLPLLNGLKWIKNNYISQQRYLFHMLKQGHNNF